MDRTGLMHMGRGERKSKHCERDAGAMTLQIERVATVARTSNGRPHGFWKGSARKLDAGRISDIADLIRASARAQGLKRDKLARIRDSDLPRRRNAEVGAPVVAPIVVDVETAVVEIADTHTVAVRDGAGVIGGGRPVTGGRPLLHPKVR
jgi:hypothetical protein